MHEHPCAVCGAHVECFGQWLQTPDLRHVYCDETDRYGESVCDDCERKREADNDKPE